MAASILKSIFSTSGIATGIFFFYLYSTVRNLHSLMNPLAYLDLSKFDVNSFVRPLWTQGENIYLQVYLSTSPDLTPNFAQAGYGPLQQQNHMDGGNDTDAHAQTTTRSGFISDEETVPGDVCLLWSESVSFPAVSKSFLLTTCLPNDDRMCMETASYTEATARLDQTERWTRHQASNEGGVLSVLSSSAGQGIESTSILVMFYQSLYEKARTLWGTILGIVMESEDYQDPTDAHLETGIFKRRTVHLSIDSPIWQSLVHSNSSVYLHVLLLRSSAVETAKWPPDSADELNRAVKKASQSHSLLYGQVNLVKFNTPSHLSKPRRILYYDLVYVWKRLYHGTTNPPPWNMQYSNPRAFHEFQTQRQMKKQGTGYSYWKPEVSIKHVTDVKDYPLDYVGLSSMPVVKLGRRSPQHPTGYSFTPAIHVDEIGLTSEKYIPINATITSLPLHIRFDRSDVEWSAAWSGSTANTGTSGAISPERWRLLSHLSSALESQKALGFEDSDIDEVRRLIADTNVLLLIITLLASALHMLFEFLTFKNEVSFWRQNEELIGLSVRALFLDSAGQTIILLFLIEQDSSLLITIPSAIGCLIAFWKCHRAAGLTFERLTEERRKSNPSVWWNFVPRLFGYELRASRLEINGSQSRQNETFLNDNKSEEKNRLAQLTLESDRIATRTLGLVLLPFVFGYTLYQWAFVPHVGWCSWIITSASSAVYALGFVLMTPQLFLNWKLKSVAHLPWRVLIYKSLNTFIDDLFSFVIRMPTMARISCFRDDVVFFIYLYQRWLYPVDTSRPVEGGVGERVSETSKSKKEQ